MRQTVKLHDRVIYINHINRDTRKYNEFGRRDVNWSRKTVGKS